MQFYHKNLSRGKIVSLSSSPKPAAAPQNCHIGLKAVISAVHHVGFVNDILIGTNKRKGIGREKHARLDWGEFRDFIRRLIPHPAFLARHDRKDISQESAFVRSEPNIRPNKKQQDE